MANKQIKAVLFDLGETLLNFGKVDTPRLFRAAAKLTYDYLKEQGQSPGGFNYYYWRNLMALRWHCWVSHLTGKDFDMLAMSRKVGARKGIKLNDEQWLHFTWLWYEPLSKLARIEPDLDQTLATLRDRGLKLGIVSNTFVNRYCLEKHLEQLGLLKHFSVRLYSYEFDFRKPNAKMFRIAAERIGQAPANILFVGDRIDKDIKPALKAGMWAVLKAAYTNQGKKIPPGVIKVQLLSELPGLIEKINTENNA